MAQTIEHSISFLRRWFAAPQETGAIAPSSRALAQALAAPYAAAPRPAAVLEVGAGTGAVTRVIGELLGPQDTLDVCELQTELVDVLARDVLPAAPLADAYHANRIRLLHGAIEQMTNLREYDFIICGLPFTGFPPTLVKTVLDTIARVLKPGGVFSYFEYVALRKLRVAFTFGSHRQRTAETSRLLDDLIRRHQIGHRTVWLNLPPARARNCQFTPAASP